MRHFAEMLSAVIDVSTHGHLFCSVRQLKLLYELLMGAVDYIIKKEEVVRREACSKGTTVSEVE